MTSIENEVASPFQRLTLANPPDYNKYSVIVNFLLTVLNLNSSVLNGTNDIDEFNFGSKQELLPNIAFPPDTWLRDSIVIKDCKIKSSILGGIITWLSQEVENDQELDEARLSHFETLLIAYNIYEVPNKSSNESIYPPPTVSLNEEDENDEETLADSYKSDKSSDQQSLQASSIYTRTSLPSQLKRMSSFSREIISSRKRLSTLLGHDNSDGTLSAALGVSFGAKISPRHSRSQWQVDMAEHNKQALISLVSKTKIYSKLSKKRESSSSNNSRNSVQTQSNRSSVLTNNLVATRSSSSSFGRTLALPSTDSINESRLPGQFQISTADQKKENRKLKFDYYAQLYKFLQITDLILKNLQGDRADYNKSIRLLEFIKKKIFKFVVIDVSQMVLDYAVLGRKQTGRTN